MSKSSSQRRFEKRAQALALLRATQPEGLARTWEQYTRGWLAEVAHRFRAQRQGAADARTLPIYDVLEQARRLAQAAQVQACTPVSRDLAVLAHECAKAVSALTDWHIYQFHSDRTARFGVSGARR